MTFFHLLHQLPDTHQQARQNLENDFRSPTHPQGISGTILAQLDQECQNLRFMPQARLSGLSALTTKYGSLQRPQEHVRIDVMPAPEVRHLVSLTVFENHHLNDSTQRGAQAQTYALWAGFHSLVTEVLQHQELREYQIDSQWLNGRIHRPGHPVWWTWAEPLPSSIQHGREYLEALALPKEFMDNAKDEGVFVEVICPLARLVHPQNVSERLPFFRTTGLEAFPNNENFRPNYRDEPWGRTHSKHALPEAISAPWEYQKQNVSLRCVLWPWERKVAK